MAIEDIQGKTTGMLDEEEIVQEIIEPEPEPEEEIIDVRDRLANTPVELWFSNGIVLDPHEVEVARELGFDEAFLARYSEKHIGEDDFYAIIPAVRILDAMERRYKVRFHPDELVENDDDFTLLLTALEGPAAGRQFTCSLRGDEEQTSIYCDNYYGVARAEDYGEFVAGRVEEMMERYGIGLDFAVEARLDQMIDQYVPLFDKFYGGAWDYDGECTVAFLDDGRLSERHAGLLADALTEEFESIGAGIDMTVGVCRGTLPSSGDMRGRLLAEAGADAGTRPVCAVRRFVESSPERRGGQVPAASLVKLSL